MIRNFNTWSLNETAKAPIDDIAEIVVSTWFSNVYVRCNLKKERGKVSYSLSISDDTYYFKQSAWFKKRTRVYNNLENIVKLITNVIGMDDVKPEVKIMKKSVGFSTIIKKYFPDEYRKTIVRREGMSFEPGPIADKIKEAYIATGEKWRNNILDDGLVFRYVGQADDLAEKTEKFYDELKRVFKTKLTSNEYGL